MTTGIERGGLFDATCPVVVDGRSVTIGWRSVGFAHWPYDPDRVAKLVPPSVSLDLYGGRAWAGYQFTTVILGRIRTSSDSTPEQSARRLRLRPEQQEVRVVVAVVDRYGRPGLYYLSIDTNRWGVAAGYRRWLNLAAFEAESLFSTGTDNRVEYWTKRPDGATARLKLLVGPTIIPTDIDRFLTARWRVVLPPRWWVRPSEDRTMMTAHDPWVLRRASIERCDDELLLAAGLPPGAGPGQALWSPGASVEIGMSQSEPD